MSYVVAALIVLAILVVLYAGLIAIVNYHEDVAEEARAQETAIIISLLFSVFLLVLSMQVDKLVVW